MRKLLTRSEALRLYCPYRQGNCQADSCMMWTHEGERPTGKEKIQDNGPEKKDKRYTIVPETEPTGFCSLKRESE